MILNGASPDADLWRSYAKWLPALFIVSQVEIAQPGQPLIGDVCLGVSRADGARCERCWNYSTHVGASADYPTICERCVKALDEIEHQPEASRPRGCVLMSGAAGARWLWLSLGVLVADRSTKFAIERYTSLSFRRPILSDIVVLVHNQNPGIAFGVFSDSSSRWLAPLLMSAAAAMMILLVWVLITGRAGGPLAQSGVALILGGVAGNTLDRLIHGGVTDFLDVRLGTYHWPAFNAADSAITIGAVLVLIELLFGGRRQADPNENAHK